MYIVNYCWEDSLPAEVLKTDNLANTMKAAKCFQAPEGYLEEEQDEDASVCMTVVDESTNTCLFWINTEGEEGGDSPELDLAEKIDQLMYDYDYYGYTDSFNSREEGVVSVIDALQQGRDGILSIITELQQVVESDDDRYVGRAKDLVHQLRALYIVCQHYEKGDCGAPSEMHVAFEYDPKNGNVFVSGYEFMEETNYSHFFFDDVSDTPIPEDHEGFMQYLTEHSNLGFSSAGYLTIEEMREDFSNDSLLGYLLENAPESLSTTLSFNKDRLDWLRQK